MPRRKLVKPAACAERTHARLAIAAMAFHRYDTLKREDAQLGVYATLDDLYERVLGRAMAQTDVVGILTTGPINLAQAHGGTWGRYDVSFEKHPEQWFVRSAPAGRIGEPLLPGEVRQVSVLVRPGDSSASATVTNVKLWRPPPDGTQEKVLKGKHERRHDRGTLTFGALGAAIHGIHVFDEVSNPKDPLGDYGGQAVLSAIATIFKESTAEICKVEASMTAKYVLGGAIAGIVVPDQPEITHCMEHHTSTLWDTNLANNQIAFGRMVFAHNQRVERDLPMKLVFMAEDVFEQMSFTGYLDMVSDPFYDGALQDDAHKPNGIPLMLAIALRIACNPDRWGLPAPLPEDAYVAKETSLLVESVLESVAATGIDGIGGEQTFTIDVVINHAWEQMQNICHKLQSGQLDGKQSGLDHKQLSRTIKDTITFLYCMGMALCVDVCGLAPQQADGSSGLYTSSGLAETLCDPSIESRTQSAYAAGLGKLYPRWPTVRTSTKGKRQVALTKLLVSVDQWLRTRKYKGTVLAHTAQVVDSVRPQDLDPSKTAEVAAAPAPTQVRSSKKKKRVVETLLAERGKQRVVADKAFASMLKNSTAARNLSGCSKTLSVEAVSQASGLFAEVLQLGGCVAMEQLFRMTSYLVTPRSTTTCINCERAVNVVQSVAFSGKLGHCPTCKRPRCLHCVAEVIEAAASCPDNGYNVECDACVVAHNPNDQ